MTVANLITVLRFPLLVIVVLVLYLDSASGYFLAAFLILMLILLDTVDGLVARWRHEQTLIGSVLDIAADRAVESVLWVVYAHLRLIPVIIPVTVIIRGALTDMFRGQALESGKSAHSMMHSKIGRWLVASGVMRTGYAAVKACAFVLLALALGLRAIGHPLEPALYSGALVFSWLSLVVCLLRGLPVVVDALSALHVPTASGRAASCGQEE